VIILSHPIGNQNVKAAALGLNDAGLLLTFMTSIASFPGSLLDRLGAIGPLSEIRRRRLIPVYVLLPKRFHCLKLVDL
jgi:hypothetical protein